MGRRIKILKTKPRERHYTGREHALAFAYFLSDDEYLGDVEDLELDAKVRRDWEHDELEAHDWEISPPPADDWD